MTITIHLQPGETISQALIRSGVMAPPGDGPHESLTIPPGVSIIGSNLKQTRIIERRTAGIPFLNYNGERS